MGAWPNKGLELTASSLRCAAASSSSSGLAFGARLFLRGKKSPLFGVRSVN